MPDFQYRIKAKHAHKEQLITNHNGEVINLAGREVKVERAATKERPAYTETIRAATADDLKALYEAAKGNHYHIEKVPVFNDPEPAISNDKADNDSAGEKAPAGDAKGNAAKAGTTK